MKILVLVAHPDDEVLGCGGTLAKLVSKGHEAHVCFVTDGVRHPPASTDSRQDSYAALDVLGVPSSNIHYLGMKTSRAEEYVIRDYTEAVENKFEQVDLLFLPSKNDLNVDHLFAYHLGLICFRPVKYCTSILSMEILSSSEWSDQPFAPNYYCDISQTVEQKKESLTRYQKQTLPFPHPRSPEAVEIKAKQRGLEVGLPYAEAFKVVRYFDSLSWGMS